jgi:hypothetical protein
MSAALDAGQRARLEQIVSRARRILEDDLSSELAGRCGIDADGTIAPEASLHLDGSALTDRREIVAVAEHLRSEGASKAAAVSRLVRETVFTHLNRLIAIRIAESLGLLPPSLADGRASRGFRDLLEAVPLLASDTAGGYWTYLRLCGDELASDVPALFDPRNPLLALAPSPRAVDELVELLSDPAAATLWTAPDCLGWVYQFFNTRDERTAMREGSPAPQDSRELAVRNQFFTPRYVVDFLVQNSLGRRLVEADPDTPLLGDLPLLVDPPTEKRTSADLREITVLDPACGSGHFLLAAYDLLEQAWLHRGVSPEEAAPAIVRSLWGIDIDPRCTQVASAAVIFRARRSRPEGSLPRPNIACARAISPTAACLDEVLQALPTIERGMLERLVELLADAPVLGSLLKAEDELSAGIKAAFIGGPAIPGTFADVLPAEDVQRAEDELLAGLTMLAHTVEATPAQRLFAAESGDAIRFVQALQGRYDAVLMNPPFGEPVPSTKPYLRTAYPWLPTKDSNLLAAFVGRGLELCKPAGYVGAITSRAGLFLTTFEDWRTQVLLGNRLAAVADLGFGIMEQALVEAAAYVVGAGKPDSGHPAAFIRVLRDTDRPAALTAAVANARAGRPDGRIFRVNVDDLRGVPGSPVAYWMAPSIRRLFTELPSFGQKAADVRQGLATGDDFRFVRAFWEVPPARIARTRDETFQGKRWSPFAKGGEYSPYWDDIHLVVDYENDGERLRKFDGSVIRNPRYYFRAGLTWPLRTASGFSPRALPSGCVFGHKGPGIFPHSESSLLLASWLTSRPGMALLASLLPAADDTTSGTASKSYEVGHIQRLPWPGERISVNGRARLQWLAAEATEARAAQDATDETSRRFVAPAGLRLTIADAAEERLEASENAALRAIEIADEADRLIAAELGLDAVARRYLDEELGPHVARYPDGAPDADRLARWYGSDIESLVDEATKAAIGHVTATKTYVADRRLELIAHGLGVSPRSIVQARRESQLSPPGQVRQVAEDVLSYLMGCVLGRWDIRLGLASAQDAPSLGTSEPVPLCPPGMLIAPDGLPAKEAPVGYPFGLPPARLVLDEHGHSWDVEEALLRAAASLWKDPAQQLADVAKALGRRTLRECIRRDFFKSHLRRYSKSRRKAPIYWPLYVPSGTWGVWVYAPGLSRETVFAVTRAAADRLDAAEREIQRLQRERDSGGAGRSARQVASALEAEERLAGELRRFRDEAERIALLGWEPDHDDGTLLCAAPLAGIFPAWRDAAIARREIKAGNYPWAAVSRWAGEL